MKGSGVQPWLNNLAEFGQRRPEGTGQNRAAPWAHAPSEAMCALPWLPATHAVAVAETDDAALAVLASEPQRCTGDCTLLGRAAPRGRAERCDMFRSTQYAAVVLVCACEGGSLPSANAALDAFRSAGAFDDAPTRADGPIWLWLARALSRAVRGCVARGDDFLAARVMPWLNRLAEQTAYTRAQFWADGGFGLALDALWQSDSPRCARAVAIADEGLVPGVVALYQAHAEARANYAAVSPRAFAAFWAPLITKLENSGNVERPLYSQLGRALARGEWRAASAWLAAWDATGLGRNAFGAVIELSALWQLCVAALTASPLGAECRLLRRVVRSDATRIFDDQGPLAARAAMLWDGAMTAHRLGAQATTGDLAPWMRLCAELHPGTTAGWIERRVRRALCAYGRRDE